MFWPRYCEIYEKFPVTFLQHDDDADDDDDDDDDEALTPVYNRSPTARGMPRNPERNGFRTLRRNKSPRTCLFQNHKGRSRASDSRDPVAKSGSIPLP